LAGRNTSYGDDSFPAKGSLVGQLNNDNNYDFTYYDYHTGSSQVVTTIGQVDIDTTSTDIYIQVTSFAEVVATALISDGDVYPTIGNTGASQGVGSAPTGLVNITRQKNNNGKYFWKCWYRHNFSSRNLAYGSKSRDYGAFSYRCGK
jgi:hypothetical protein